MTADLMALPFCVLGGRLMADAAIAGSVNSLSHRARNRHREILLMQCQGTCHDSLNFMGRDQLR